VSIALSMHNAARTIEPTLRSLVAQTCTDWELILVDDGSTDDSVPRARRYADSRFRVIVDGQRRGLAVRLNQTIELARSRYFARMDADDVAYPERLERQLTFLRAHPEVDLLGTGMMIFADGGRPVGVYDVRTTHATICERPLSGFYLAHPTWMGRIEWFRKWHYDPVCSKAQDQDLLLRAWRSSRYAALPEPLVGYRQDALSVRKSLLGRYYFSRAILRVSKHEGRLGAGVAAVVVQAAKLVVDTVTIGAGMASLLKHRALPFPKAEAERWHRVWVTLTQARLEERSASTPLAR
jgi:glycosyltransferase involved in cell wall biosynthesis